MVRQIHPKGPARPIRSIRSALASPPAYFVVILNRNVVWVDLVEGLRFFLLFGRRGVSTSPNAKYFSMTGASEH